MMRSLLVLFLTVSIIFSMSAKPAYANFDTINLLGSMMPDLPQPFQTVASLVGLAGACATPGFECLAATFTILGNLLGGGKKQKPEIGYEFRGERALEALRKQGFILSGDISPDNVRAVAVPGRGYFTPEELEAYGWIRREDGTWVPGPNAKNLPYRGDALGFRQVWEWSNIRFDGPSIFIVGQPVNVRFSANARLKLIDTTTGKESVVGIDLASATVTILEQQPGCQFVKNVVLTARVDGLTDSIMFPFYYNVQAFGSSQANFAQRTCSESNRIGEFKRINEGIKEEAMTPDRLLVPTTPQGSNEVIIGDGRPNEDKTPEEALEDILNNIGRPSGFSGGGFGGIGGGGFSGEGPSPLAIRDALNRLEQFGKNNIDNEADLKALQDYIRNERLFLQNATPQQRLMMVTRMQSVDEIIKSGNYIPGRLSDVLDEIKSTGNYLPGDWVSLIFSPEMNGNNEYQLETKVNNFLKNILPY